MNSIIKLKSAVYENKMQKMEFTKDKRAQAKDNGIIKKTLLLAHLALRMCEQLQFKQKF